MTEVREEHKPTSVLDNTTRTGRQNDVKAGGVSSALHLQLPISGGPGLHATLHFAVVTTSASLSSSPGSQPLPTQLTAFRGNQNPQEKWDAWPCPPLKPKQVCPDTWPLPMPPGEGRQHLAPRRGPPPPHCLLKGLLCFPPCTLQGAQFSPQRPLPVTRVHTLKPPRAPRPTPPCPAQMVLKLRAQSRRPAGSLHQPSAATPPPCRPGPRGCQAGPQVTSRDTAVTPHHPGQPPSCVPCPSLKGGCPSCPVLEFSPLSTDPPRRTPSIQLDS